MQTLGYKFIRPQFVTLGARSFASADTATFKLVSCQRF
jgi:hypothetical protein